jgi:hypothetical protein
MGGGQGKAAVGLPDRGSSLCPLHALSGAVGGPRLSLQATAATGATPSGVGTASNTMRWACE